MPASAAAQASSAVAVERPRPPQRPSALERARRRAGEHAVAVGAAARRRGGRRSRPGAGSLASTLTSPGSSAVQRAQRRRLAGVARHLAAGVHARGRCGPATVSSTWRAQHRRERLLEHALHGAQPRLARPAGELRAVVLEQQPGGQGPTRACARRSRRYSASIRTGPSPPPTSHELERARPSMRRRTARAASASRAAASVGADSAELAGERLRRARPPDASVPPLELDPRGQPLEALARRSPRRPTPRPAACSGGARRVARGRSRTARPTKPSGVQAVMPDRAARAHDPEQLARHHARAAAR